MRGTWAALVVSAPSCPHRERDKKASLAGVGYSRARARGRVQNGYIVNLTSYFRMVAARLTPSGQGFLP